MGTFRSWSTAAPGPAVEWTLIDLFLDMRPHQIEIRGPRACTRVYDVRKIEGVGPMVELLYTEWMREGRVG